MRIFKKLTAAFVALAITVSGGVLAFNTAQAATGKLYLTPASPNVNYGKNVTLNLRLTPGTAVNGVTASVTFDTAKLKYVSINTSSSAFPIQLSQSVNGGTITLDRGILNSTGTNKDGLVASITFQSRVYNGTTTVGVSGNATKADGSGYTNPSVAGATVYHKPGSCPSSQIGTPPNCKKPTPISTPTQPKPQQPKKQESTPKKETKKEEESTNTTKKSEPKEEQTKKEEKKSTAQKAEPAGAPTLSSEDIAYTTASLKVSTKDKVRVYAEYGLNNQLNLRTNKTKASTSHTVKIDPKTLIPGGTYTYRLVAETSKGQLARGNVHTFSTKGLVAKFIVVDKNRTPLANKEVELHSEPTKGTTDENGAVTFSNVTPGLHKLVYKAGGKEYTSQVQVINNVATEAGAQVAPVQNFSIVYEDFTQPNLWWLSPWFIGTLLLIAAVVAAGFFLKSRPNLFNRASSTPVDTSGVIGSSQTTSPAAPAASSSPATNNQTPPTSSASTLWEQTYGANNTASTDQNQNWPNSGKGV